MAASVLLVVLLSVGGAMGVATVAWGEQLRDEGRLLPGTTIAAVSVGGQTTDEAIRTVRDHLDGRLDRELVLADGSRTWTTSARELGGTADVEAAVVAARERTEAADFGDLARVRWVGGGASFAAEVGVVVPEAGIADFVATIARDIDVAPADATARWTATVAEVSPATVGRTLDRDATAGRVRELLAGEDTTADLPVIEVDPNMTNALVGDVVAVVEDEVAAVRAHTVDVEVADVTHTIEAGELAPAINAAAVLDTALRHASRTGEVAVGGLVVSFDDAAVAAVVDELAGPHEVAVRDAAISLDDGNLRIVPERAGVSADRQAAIEDLHVALAGGADQVDIELVTTEPAVTADRFEQVLLLDQSARRVHLYEGGERARSWSVAVGTNNSPTPTGTFVVGAKRFEPTWVNPAPERWGRDMPARIGPGPENPLGPRAINWNTLGGRDTLIRFHGTPNEASVGRASSNGCVRMYGDDVIELYGLIATGTTIVSIH
ncbi:MAG: L,D-transpeptidase family protein [Egicoccus sp.]